MTKYKWDQEEIEPVCKLQLSLVQFLMLHRGWTLKNCTTSCQYITKYKWDQEEIKPVCKLQLSLVQFPTPIIPTEVQQPIFFMANDSVAANL
jgi:hypothetical protein